MNLASERVAIDDLDVTSADRDACAGIADNHDGTPPFVPKDDLLNAPLRQMLRLE